VSNTVTVECEVNGAVGYWFSFRTVAVPAIGDTVSFARGNLQVLMKVTKRDWIIDRPREGHPEFRCVLMCDLLQSIPKREAIQ